MTIEFQTPYGKVSETLVNSIRNKLLDLSHIHKNISRAEVLLREDIRAITGVNKVCEINLSIYGANLYVHTRTESFEISAKDGIAMIEGVEIYNSLLLHKANKRLIEIIFAYKELNERAGDK